MVTYTPPKSAPQGGTRQFNQTFTFGANRPASKSSSRSNLSIRQQEHKFQLKSKKSRQCNPILKSDYVDTERVVLPPLESKGLSKKDKVLSALSTIMDRFHDDRIHPSVKSKHVDDLFQIACFLADDNAKLSSKVSTLEEQVSMDAQRIQHFETMEKSDHDLMVESPSRDDYNKLKESVSTLEKDINGYKAQHCKEYMEHAVATSFTPSTSHPYMVLLSKKLFLLEDFTMTLKKQIQILEQADADVARLNGAFGSVEGLLVENNRLSESSNMFEWSKKRYDPEYILRHDHLMSSDVPFLKALVFALQRELRASMDVMHYYNYEANSSLKLATVVANEHVQYRFDAHPEYESLEFLMNSCFVESDDYVVLDDAASFISRTASEGEAIAAEEPSSLLKQRLYASEVKNKLLKEQLVRLSEELSEKSTAFSLLQEQYAAKQVSRFALKQIETSARRVLQQISHINQRSSEREATYVFQLEQSLSLDQRLRAQHYQISKLSERLLCERATTKKLQSKLRNAHRASESLYRVASSLAVLASPSSFPPSVSSLYQVTYASLSRMLFAVIRIQSFFRGYRTRRRLLASGSYNILVSPHKSKKSSHLDPVKSSPSFSVSVPSPLPPLSSSSSSFSLSSSRLDRSFSILRDVQSLVSRSSSDLSSLSSLRSSLSLLKSSLSSDFKDSLLSILSSAESDLFSSLSSDLLSGISSVTSDRSFVPRSTQTVAPSSSSKSLQVGVSQFSNVSISSQSSLGKKKKK